MTFYKLVISKIIRETSKSVSIVFNIPDSLKKFYQFKAGQYVTIKLTLDGKEIRRSYSMSAAPYENELKITVKEVENGLFSQFANKNLQVGHLLEVSAPEGKFIFESNSTPQNYLLIAAGSGITPVFSITKSILSSEKESKVVLIYGNKSLEDTIFYQEIVNLETQFPDRFQYYMVFSQSKEENAYFGRIEQPVLYNVLKNKQEGVSFTATYLCGPEKMIEQISESLINYGVKKETIHYELFTSGNQEKITVSTEGNTKITVVLDQDEKTFNMSKKTIVLDAVLKAGLDAPYSCQGGVCSSCMAKIVKGSATMVKNNVLTDSEIAEGLILTCQAHATSDELVIDYDDV
ncbi:MAG: 2Fe-2S iron-sulfur cluster-binding protein [Flavobacterium sp.]